MRLQSTWHGVPSVVAGCSARAVLRTGTILLQQTCQAELAGGAAASAQTWPLREVVSSRRMCGMRGRSPLLELWVTGRCQGTAQAET